MPPLAANLPARPLLCLLLLAMTLPSSGCIAAAVTAGVVGAGAAGYAYYQGAVPRDVPVAFDQLWATAPLALGDLGMPVVSAVRDGDSATIESRTGDGSKVLVTLEPRAARVPADGQWTHVTVRVAWLGDSQVTERIFTQIDSRLGLATPPGQQPQVLHAQPAPVAGQTGPPPMATPK